MSAVWCISRTSVLVTALSTQIKTAHLFQYYSWDLFMVTDEGVDVLIHIVLVTRKISDKCTSSARCAEHTCVTGNIPSHHTDGWFHI
jgi:hypothetical protein